MAGPHPVIGIAAEFSYVRRRGADKSYIFIHFCHKKVKLVAMIKRSHAGLVVRSFHGFRFEILRRQRNQITSIKITPFSETGDEAAT